ncbi:MAG: hypothetical protein M1395_07200 [Bacteroidetes bacterium]|nr:hypothetical protein [Bacteroidota bacterium]
MKSLFAAMITVLVISTSGFSQYKLEYKASGSTPIYYKSHTSLERTESVMGQTAKVSLISDQTISMTSKKSGGDLVYLIKIDSSENVAVMPNGDTSRSSSPTLGKLKETRIHPDGDQISSRWLDTAFAQSQAGEAKDNGSFFIKLPGKKVSKGSTWNQLKVDTIGTPGTAGSLVVNTTTGYKFVDEEKFDGTPCARIDFTGQVALQGSTSAQGVEVAIKGNGTISGSVLFDYANGKIMKIKGKSDQDVTMSSSGSHPVSVPMNQKTDYDLLLIK